MKFAESVNRRRTTRLECSVPLLVLSQDPRHPFHGRCDTMDISSCGARLSSTWLLPPGTPVRVDVLGGSGIAAGKVIRVRPGMTRRYEMGIRFDREANVWDVRQPPPDWCV